MPFFCIIFFCDPKKLSRQADDSVDDVIEEADDSTDDVIDDAADEVSDDSTDDATEDEAAPPFGDWAPPQDTSAMQTFFIDCLN